MDLVYLEEDQNEVFDAEYHDPPSMTAKLDVLRKLFPRGPRTILDLGGGTGRFTDSLLSEFPEAHGTVFDVSELLLGRNEPSERKTLVQGSVDMMGLLLGGQKFDLIAINWLLHHLVGPTRRVCRANCVEVLKACKDLLADGGAIVVAENAFDGFFGSNIPSWTIFHITRIQNPSFVRLARRFFNTAGTGVCFRSGRNWQSVFAEAGFSSESVFHQPWGSPWTVRAKLLALGLAAPAQEHFVLR